MRGLKKIVIIYFAVVGLTIHIVLAISVFMFADMINWDWYAINRFWHKADVTINQLKPSNITTTPRFPLHVLEGKIKRTYPRILLPELSNWNQKTPSVLIQARQKLYREYGKTVYNPCEFRDMLSQTVCWLMFHKQGIDKKILTVLRNKSFSKPNAMGSYGNVWSFVLVYDLLWNNPNITADDKLLFENRLRKLLKQYLQILNQNSASLWHGRTTLASIAWLIAIVLDVENPENQALITQAQAHFLDVVDAIALTEVWPSGYNYWIQNRALLFVLASSAYLNGVSQSQYHEKIKYLVERIGLWHIYMTRPDNKIEGYGDEGSRIDLKDETRRVIDLIAQITKNPVFATYSDYLEHLYQAQSYNSGYRWGFLLFNDPSITPLSDVDITDLSGLERYLPTAEIFGAKASNHVFIRPKWGKNQTFINFRAGHHFTHHQHYDAGHISIFKGNPLAINSSVYAGIKTDNRLNYSVRTIAKNSLLILRPNEIVKPNRFFKHNVSDGGQRVITPTGSAVTSVKDWKDNLYHNQYFAGGELIHFIDKPKQYVSVAVDLTRAYNSIWYDDNHQGGKVKLVTRNLWYYYPNDQLIIFDRIVATNKRYLKKWLLHTVSKPRALEDTPKVLRGKLDNGILESRSKHLLVQNRNSYLDIRVIYPEKPVVRFVGGGDYQYYVEDDADESDLNGHNYNQGAVSEPWFDEGFWRIELQPSHMAMDDHFLVVLSPTLDSPSRRRNMTPLNIQGKAYGLQSEDFAVIFLENSHQNLSFEIKKLQQKVYIVGCRPLQKMTVDIGRKPIVLQANSSGIVVIEANAGTTKVGLHP